jgi:hypothetical protein
MAGKVISAAVEAISAVAAFERVIYYPPVEVVC